MSLNNSFNDRTIICNERKEVDLDALNLLAFGEITQLCSCTYKNENKHHQFLYDTKDLIPFTQLQAGLTFENVIDILGCAAEMIKKLADNNLVLDNVKNAKDYIFRADSGYKFIYFPIVQKPHITHKDYILKLLSVLHHKDSRLISFSKELRKKKDNAQVLDYLLSFVYSYNGHYNAFNNEDNLINDEGNTTLLDDGGETSLLGMNSDWSNASSLHLQGESNINHMSDEGETSLLGLSINEKNVYALPVSDEGETTVLSQGQYLDEYDSSATDCTKDEYTEYYQDESGEYETTVLTSQPSVQNIQSNREIKAEDILYLIRNINGEKIAVDVTPFTIGKDSVNMDCVICNDSVSRHHATIIYDDGYYIMDNHSTNGTTIEGVRLQPDERGEIGNGYIIALGNESFRTHIERR